MFVTIAEIHTLILDDCLHTNVFSSFLRCFFYLFDSFDFIEKVKMVCSTMTVLL